MPMLVVRRQLYEKFIRLHGLSDSVCDMHNLFVGMLSKEEPQLGAIAVRGERPPLAALELTRVSFAPCWRSVRLGRGTRGAASEDGDNECYGGERCYHGGLHRGRISSHRSAANSTPTDARDWLRFDEHSNIGARIIAVSRSSWSSRLRSGATRRLRSVPTIG